MNCSCKGCCYQPCLVEIFECHHQDPDLFKLLRLCKSWAFCKSLIFGRPTTLRVGFVSLSSSRSIGPVPLVGRVYRLTLAPFFGHRLANESDLTALASVSPSRPLIRNLLLPLICFWIVLCTNASYGLSLRLCLSPLCSWLKGALPGTLPKQHRAKKKIFECQKTWDDLEWHGIQCRQTRMCLIQIRNMLFKFGCSSLNLTFYHPVMMACNDAHNGVWDNLVK